MTHELSFVHLMSTNGTYSTPEHFPTKVVDDTQGALMTCKWMEGYSLKHDECRGTMEEGKRCHQDYSLRGDFVSQGELSLSRYLQRQ